MQKNPRITALGKGRIWGFFAKKGMNSAEKLEQWSKCLRQKQNALEK